MKKALLLCCGGLALIAVSAFAFSSSWRAGVTAGAGGDYAGDFREPVDVYRGFDVQILVDGRPLEEYAARDKSYVEAIAGAEYEVRIRNPLPYRVAVSLSVDGLNSIDARHTTAWNASKWVIEPYGTITVSGWQMSSERARQFYFTSERDSYGAKLGQTSSLGIISAVFFREHRPYPVPITPPRPRPIYEEDGRNKSSEAPTAGSAQSSVERSDSARGGDDSMATRKGKAAPQPDDEYAATGIGRSVHNDVRWVNVDLDSRAAGEVVIRYEYYPALVQLGILPRRYERPNPLRRREGARGFEDRRFSPEP
ncbi:MAG: hypothetical protein ABJC10_11715 [Acidobacteriota bacterium]